MADSEGACFPGWSSDKTIWVSRRVRGLPTWVEVDADTGKATGRTQPGLKDCMDGDEDPLSPVSPDLRVITKRTSEVRFKRGPW